MTASLVVTLQGIDRPGVIARVADCARSRGASWQQSRFVHLAGRFAGVVLIEADDAEVAALESALSALGDADLEVRVARPGADADADAPRFALELVGQDRPGIVRDVAGVLARHGVNIDDLETEVESASMSGELLFHARADLVLPAQVDVEALRADLERLANELMVDLHVDEQAPGDD